jgi:hypothetical protein
MSFRDVVGNNLTEGDQVAIGLALGQTVLGTVQKVDSVLSGNPNSQPMVHVSVVFTLPALANGLITGIVKAASPASQVQAAE